MMKLICCATRQRDRCLNADVIVVASISCIYGPGIPAEYLKAAIPLKWNGSESTILRDLASVQYSRNDLEIGRGRFRVRGDVLEIGLTKTELSGWNSMRLTPFVTLIQ